MIGYDHRPISVAREDKMKRVGKDISERSSVLSVARREALFSISLAFLYFAWWYITAYGLGSRPVDEYTYIAGFPAWFFLSCIAGFLVFSVLAFLMVKLFFTEIDLDSEVKRGNIDHD
jgi:uncharacterized membrane protein YhdT